MMGQLDDFIPQPEERKETGLAAYNDVYNDAITEEIKRVYSLAAFPVDLMPAGRILISIFYSTSLV